MEGDILHKLLRSGNSFALYFLPGETELEMIVGPSERVTDISNRRGFIFAPYSELGDYVKLIIDPVLYVKGREKVLTSIDILPQSIDSFALTDFPDVNISRYYFESLVNEAIDDISSDSSLKKVVLSRPISQPLNEDFDAFSFLCKMREGMPNAFSYMLFTPESGLWMGATPERLFEFDGSRGYTNSIAGTLPVATDKVWSVKEENEQQIVSDYILKRLNNVDVTDISVTGPTTIKSGSVQHLKTEFSFPLSANGRVSELIDALHPTPAICGMPSEMAQTFIKEKEGYDRSYYAGYLGPLGVGNSHSIFVNLRCMKVNHKTATLFVGAGISEGSIASAEWEETQTKALTLQNLLQRT